MTNTNEEYRFVDIKEIAESLLYEYGENGSVDDRINILAKTILRVCEADEKIMQETGRLLESENEAQAIFMLGGLAIASGYLSTALRWGWEA